MTPNRGTASPEDSQVNNRPDDSGASPRVALRVLMRLLLTSLERRARQCMQTIEERLGVRN